MSSPDNSSASRKEQPAATSGRPLSSSSRGRGRGSIRRSSNTALNLQASPGSATSMEPVVNISIPGNEALLTGQAAYQPASVHSDPSQSGELQAPLKVFNPPKPGPAAKRGRGRRSLTSDEIQSSISPGMKTDIGEPMEAVVVPRQSEALINECYETRSAGFYLTTDQTSCLPKHLAVAPSQQLSDTSNSLSQESEGTTSTSSVSNSEVHTIVLQISNLPPDGEVPAHDIGTYFEHQGEEVDVISTQVLPDGKASVKLVGLTTEELASLQKKRHRIRKKLIQVTVSTMMYDSDEPPNEAESDSPPMDTIVVTNLPLDCGDEYVSMFFESKKKSNGCPDSVESCTISAPGTAHVKFKSPEFAAKVMERERHTIKGQDLHLQYKITHVSKVQERMVELNKLLLCNIPEDLEVDTDYLNLFVSNQLEMDDEEFSVQLDGDTAMVEFGIEYTCEALKMMMEKLTSKPLKKGVIVDAQLYKASVTIQISNMTKHYEEEFMNMYFENPKSGGGPGKVSDVEMLGNGEATVTFQNPQVITSVLNKKHPTFGENCTVRKLDSFQSTTKVHAEHLTMSETMQSCDEPIHDSAAQGGKSHQTLDSIEVKVEPLVAKCIKNDQSILQKSVQELHVSFEVFTKQGKIRITSSKLSKAGWQKDATEKVEACLAAHFTVKHGMRVHKDSMQELIAFLSNVKSETMLEYEFVQNGKMLNAAGARSAVNVVEEKAHEIFTMHEQTTVDVKLTPENSVFFEKVKQQQVQESFPHVSFKLNAKNSSLKLHGSVCDTMLIKAQLPEILVHESVEVPLDSLVTSYFSTPHGNRELDELIKYSPCQVAPFFKAYEGVESSLQLLCNPNESAHVSRILENICRLTDFERLQLPESYTSVQHTVSEEYSTLCAKLQTKSNNQIIISRSQMHISVAGIAESVHQCTPILRQFIKEKSSVILSTELDKGEWRLLSIHMQDKLEVFLSKCQSVEVEVEQPTSIEEPCIVLKGDMIAVNKLDLEISELRKSICKTAIPIERPGTCNFLLSKNTRLVFDGLETRNQVAIEVTEPIEEESKAVGSNEIKLSPQFKRKCIATIKTKQMVIYIGDITEFHKAEVIVNAANVDLKHIGGVAMAISNKGGPTIQQDSDQHVRRKGRLSVGEAWLTKQVGNLPCKALVHTVGPVWSGGWKKEEALLGKACKDSLYAAKSYNSIVFPAISSGIYGFPITKCAETMVNSMIEFCKRNPMCDLREIGIILPPSKTTDVIHFVKALRKNLPADSVHADLDTEELEGAFSIPSASKLQEPSTVMSRKPKSKRVPAVSSSMLNLIKLRKGSLLDVKAEVYVNTTNNNLDLSQGAVSKALLKAGGQSLQTECIKQRPISTGDIAVTGPGNLPCSYVFHTVVPSYNGGQGEKVLRHSVQKCLKKCSSLGMSSIAFPAIGTGNLGYPNDAVARTMIKAITDYMSSHKSTPITSIHLVIFMDNTYQAFQQELQGYTSGTTFGTGGANGVETHSHSVSIPKPKSHRQYRSAPLRVDSPVAGTATHKEPTFTIGTLQVQVLNGDITEESTDVIVNPTNSILKLEGQGVAGALLRKGGPELQRLCDTVIANGKRLEGERVAVTDRTGKLKCKSLFHINFEGNDTRGFVKVITNCLKKAEDTKYNSISFPAIGTGTHGYPPQEAAAGMMKAIEQFSASHPQYIKCIRLVLFQPSAYQEFLAKFRNPVQPGLWQRVLNYAMPSKSTPTWKTDESIPEEFYSLDTEEEPELKELRIMVYGNNDKNIRVVEQVIYSLIDDHLTTEVVDDPYVDQLSASEVQTLKKKGKELQVDTKIYGAPLNQISLKGERADVHQMKSYVIESFAKFERSAGREKEAAGRKREAEQLYKLIKWKQIDPQDSSSEDYDPEINYEIEMAYLNQDCKYTHQDQTQHFTVDFSKLQVIDNNNGGATASVERCDLMKMLQQGDRPKTWEPMPTDPSTGGEVSVHIVDLKPTDEEYLETNKQFDQTMSRVVANPPNPSAVGLPLSSRSSNSYTSIVKIQRIQNPLLYTQYMARKKEVDKRNPSGSQTSERRLFHGTADATCKAINQHGFNRSYSGKNATVYGKGVYFARDAYYSARDTYSPRDTNGYKYVYLARVITGEFTVASRDMIDTPTKPDDTKYDSAVDNVQNPQIFIVFQDAVVYPEYLIVFT